MSITETNSSPVKSPKAKKSPKKVAKKAAKKAVKKVAKKKAAGDLPKWATMKSPSIDDVVKLMRRKDGATIDEMHEIGFKQPAQAAVKAAKRKGFKTSQKKAEGEFTRYYATGTPK